ncbi:hypothetical protein COY23_00760 [bacterium (Candidatus Torokbacteria) CG_4_10_14_0_2_um_filter_35_8]|nr:MAG: hypothetical protein COY23_00760 [bacterium (Candidatus Torokbacteria) CG_4_10_14_0_2_um_filter_35_8]
MPQPNIKKTSLNQSLISWIILILVIAICGVAIFIAIRRDGSLFPQEEKSTPTQENQNVNVEVTVSIPEELEKELKAKGPIVTILKEELNPIEVTIKKGESVSWFNADSAEHQLTSEGFIKSDKLKQRSIVTMPINIEGTFEYTIDNNDNLKGKIIVK